MKLKIRYEQKYEILEVNSEEMWVSLSLEGGEDQASFARMIVNIAEFEKIGSRGKNIIDGVKEPGNSALADIKSGEKTTINEVSNIFRKGTSTGGTSVTIKQLKQALGRKRMSIKNYELEYVEEILDLDGEIVFAQMSTIGNDVVRGASGNPLIKITARGLSSMEEAVASTFHEIHHVNTFLQSGVVSSEEHAETYGQSMLKKFKSKHKGDSHL